MDMHAIHSLLFHISPAAALEATVTGTSSAVASGGGNTTATNGGDEKLSTLSTFLSTSD